MLRKRKYSVRRKIKKKSNKKHRKTRCKGGTNDKLDGLSQTIESLKFLMELNLDQKLLPDSLSLAREKKPYDENYNIAEEIRKKRRERENEEKGISLISVGGTRKKSKKYKKKTVRR